MNTDTPRPLPLWLLYEDEVEGWRAALPAESGAWVAENNFKGEKHRVLLIANAAGGVAFAGGGLGKRQGGMSLWLAAGFAERLPARAFRCAQSWSDADATQLCLGFAYGAYRFERYRPSRLERGAVLEPPANADLAYVAHALESLRLARDLINTPAGDLGPGELAAAAEQMALRHGAIFREWVGAELLANNLPAIHAVGRARAAAPRLGTDRCG